MHAVSKCPLVYRIYSINRWGVYYIFALRRLFEDGVYFIYGFGTFVRIFNFALKETLYNKGQQNIQALMWFLTIKVVHHRVNEILKLTNKRDWGHCPGVENPADIGSRGVIASQLKDNKLWWVGPD